jgi:HPr kinase/phosphorylase
MVPAAHTVHATAVSICGKGVLIIGPPGSGKSDLALRLMDRGAQLICDDRVVVDTSTTPPTLRQAPNIAGKIELRGVGIVSVPCTDTAALYLCVLLNETEERMPSANAVHVINGVTVAKLCLHAFAASTPIKIEIALRQVRDQS